MQEKDYVKLYRSFLEWEWYKNINTKVLFLHMLLKANWKSGKFEGKEIPRGSFISSIKKLSDETDLTEREIRTAISNLKATGEVTSIACSKYSVFTVVNYDIYQSCDKHNDTQPTGERHSNDILTPTIEEKKEGKKGRSKKEVPNGTKKKIPLVYFDDDELNTAFAEFVTFREELKKPMTDKAITLAIKKLTEMAANSLTGELDKAVAKEILEQSVLNNWAGIFPLKGSGNRQSNAGKIDWGKI